MLPWLPVSDILREAAIIRKLIRCNDYIAYRVKYLKNYTDGGKGNRHASLSWVPSLTQRNDIERCLSKFLFCRNPGWPTRTHRHWVSVFPTPPLCSHNPLLASGKLNLIKISCRSRYIDVTCNQTSNRSLVVRTETYCVFSEVRTEIRFSRFWHLTYATN
jgi:hypothetical protein